MTQGTFDEKKLDKPCSWCGSNKPTQTTRVFDSKVFCSKECLHGYKVSNNLIPGRPPTRSETLELFELQRQCGVFSKEVEIEAGFSKGYLSQVFSGQTLNPQEIKLWKEAIERVRVKKETAIAPIAKKQEEDKKTAFVAINKIVEDMLKDYKKEIKESLIKVAGGL